MGMFIGAVYICDRCGKVKVVKQVLTPVKGKRNQFYEDYPTPDGWIIHKGAKYTCENCSDKK